MATYCFSREDEIIERSFDTGKAPKFILVGKRKFYRDFGAEGVSVPSTAWANPIHCLASGVHPSQAQELRDHFRKCGVPTDVDNDGNPIYTSAAHRKKALKCRGFTDRSSYLQ